jgi:flagellar biosynthesis/type III secretory pathway M-ring protein FliF/YscJ
LGFKLAIILPPVVAVLILIGAFFYWYRFRRQRRMQRSEEIYKSPDPGDLATAAPPRPSKHRALLSETTTAQQHSDEFHATDDGNLLDSHAKPSILRRRAEMADTASTEPSGTSGTSDSTQEENLRRQLEQLRIELDRAREDAIPPPYIDAI